MFTLSCSISGGLLYSMYHKIIDNERPIYYLNAGAFVGALMGGLYAFKKLD